MSISAITDKDTFHRGVSVSLQARIPIHREVSVPLQARIPSTEGYQCRSRQGYLPQRGISAITDKDTFHRGVSVSHQARIPIHREVSVSAHRQGCYPQRSISAATGKDTIHRDVSVPPLARISSTEMYQCYLKQGCFHRSISAFQQPP